MDRDIALGISTVLNGLKTTLQALATNTIPTVEDSRSVEQQRSLEESEEPEVPEEPEELKEEPEPVTTRKK